MTLWINFWRLLNLAKFCFDAPDGEPMICRNGPTCDNYNVCLANCCMALLYVCVVNDFGRGHRRGNCFVDGVREWIPATKIKHSCMAGVPFGRAGVVGRELNLISTNQKCLWIWTDWIEKQYVVFNCVYWGRKQIYDCMPARCVCHDDLANMVRCDLPSHVSFVADHQTCARVTGNCVTLEACAYLFLDVIDS